VLDKLDLNRMCQHFTTVRIRFFTLGDRKGKPENSLKVSREVCT
jgi:hypothetical protein